ncbi:MAG: hypothetical protein COT17_04605 [Elusimicrobia bacterium CG08_land_8_20_14_0_20_51_18]|nr:MAG: hypothetical protein COT17_04605 [Elusimicrobia bacterium CG08_land_8_20_14_0_20_51_18]
MCPANCGLEAENLMTYIKLKVHASSKENKILKKKDDAFEIWTKEPAENGRANSAALGLLAKALGVEVKKIALVKGAHSPSKIVLLRVA